jgi:Transposase DDE domain
MHLAAQIAALIATLSTGVVYGTDAFCALVQRPALARVDDAAASATSRTTGRCGERSQRTSRPPGPSATGPPEAAIIDSQSVKAAEEVARTGRGCEAGKKVNGRKRHIAVDVMGMLLTVMVTAASAGPRRSQAAAAGPAAGVLKLTLQIVKRPDDLHTFKVLLRRWVVERTLAWITRRTVRDCERLPAHHETYVYWSVIIVTTRRLARKPAPAGTSAQPQAA